MMAMMVDDNVCNDDGKNDDEDCDVDDDDDDYLPPGRATSARRVISGSVSGEEVGEIGDLIMTSLN